MKLKPIVSVLVLRERLTHLIVMAVLLFTPLIGICQPPPPDAAGNPEVPFDNDMNMFFLAAGILFAVIVTIKYFRKKATAIV